MNIGGSVHLQHYTAHYALCPVCLLCAVCLCHYTT
uniref:Uncharacterized protein n=1 Tax=Anguilla anguilla TaxID=7936 RepID=A0A0E9SZ12_ANGAN